MVLLSPKTLVKRENLLNINILSPLINEYLDLWEINVEEVPIEKFIEYVIGYEEHNQDY